MTEGARIGHQIQRLRILSGCTQEEVANDLRISQSYLRQIEHGCANPSVNMAAKIISHLLFVITGEEQEVELFRLDELLERVAVWRYRMVSETRHDPDIGWFPTYAIQAEGQLRGKWIHAGILHDVALDHGVVWQIVDRMNEYQLSPEHLLEEVLCMLP